MICCFKCDKEASRNYTTPHFILTTDKLFINTTNLFLSKNNKQWDFRPTLALTNTNTTDLWPSLHCAQSRERISLPVFLAYFNPLLLGERG